MAPSQLSTIALGLSHLTKRDTGKVNPAAGAKSATSINSLGIQILIALIAVGMTLTALWFFFMARNGGFKWRRNDWEDYKSTVLRRKGPDGKTLSNATKSTKLGGGSVVHGGSFGADTYGEASTVGYTDETGTSADHTEHPNEMREVEEGKGRHKFGIRGGEAKYNRVGHEHDNDRRDPQLREYRNERSARVGGLNRQADGLYTDYSNTEPSDLGSNLSARPLIINKDRKDKKDKDKKEKEKKEAKAKELRAKERMKAAKLAGKEAAKNVAAEAKAQKEVERAQRQAAKTAVKNEKKAKKAKSEAAPSVAPPMTERTAPSIYLAPTEYTAPSVYTAPSEYGGPSKAAPSVYTVPKQSAPSAYTIPAQAAHPAGPRRAPPSAAYSFTTGDDQTVYTGTYSDNHTQAAPSVAAPTESSYYSDYRPNAEPLLSSSNRRSRSHAPVTDDSRSRRSTDTRSQRPTSQSPRKPHRSAGPRRSSTANYTPVPAAPASISIAQTSSDIFTQTNGNVQGTIAYPCHIPGLSSSVGSIGVSESVSQVGGSAARQQERRQQRDVMAGYRRGGPGGVRTVRRDSLSDSDA